VAVGPEETADRLTQVDDVDQIAFAVDVRPHLGIPPAGAVSEVDAGLDQVLHLDDGHALPSCPPPGVAGLGVGTNTIPRSFVVAGAKGERVIVASGFRGVKTFRGGEFRPRLAKPPSTLEFPL